MSTKCRVIGIAGGAERGQLAVEKLGLDACIHRSGKDFEAQVRAACPIGVGVFIDTLGDRATDAVLPLMKVGGCIAAVAQTAGGHPGESSKGRLQGSTAYLQEVIARRLTVRGMIASNHAKRPVKEFDSPVNAWIDARMVKPMEAITEGLESTPEAFQGLFEGKNRGTRRVKVAD